MINVIFLLADLLPETADLTPAAPRSRSRPPHPRRPDPTDPTPGHALKHRRPNPARSGRYGGRTGPHGPPRRAGRKAAPRARFRILADAGAPGRRTSPGLLPQLSAAGITGHPPCHGAAMRRAVENPWASSASPPPFMRASSPGSGRTGSAARRAKARGGASQATLPSRARKPCRTGRNAGPARP